LGTALTTQYNLDLNNSLTQVLSDGTNRYLYGMGRIAQQTPNGLQYFLPDALGSARQLTDAAGAPILAQSFDPYGGLLSSQGTAATPYGFTGEWGDASGLLYLRARYYLPQAGIFTSRDTWIGDFTAPASLNRYLYARNNPLRYIDPTGHDVWDTIGEFSTGMVYEFAWASSWVSPQRPWILAPGSCESVARLAGRSVGDILAILVGMDWIGSGIGGIGTGLTMCGTGVLCPAGVGVVAVSEVAVAAGSVLTVGGAVGLGGNLALLTNKKQGRSRGLSQREIQQSISSLEKNIAEHEAKLNAYIEDPYAFDNQGLLRNAPNDEVRQAIINGRISHLQNEIDNWRRQVDALRRLLDR
jgi:RHS repeat-associated protein